MARRKTCKYGFKKGTKRCRKTPRRRRRRAHLFGSHRRRRRHRR